MQKGDLRVAGADARLFINEPNVGRFQLLQLPGEVVGFKRQMMQSFAAFFEESLNGTVGRGRFEQFDRGLARLQNCHAHFLLGHLFDPRQPEPEYVDPKPAGLVNALHRNAHVVDPVDHITPRRLNSAH